MAKFTQVPEYRRIRIHTQTRSLFGREKNHHAWGFELLDDLIFESDLLDETVVVEKGFVTDGASVPQLFWNLYPPHGDYLESAAVHDLFCDLGAEDKSPISSRLAAQLFAEAMTSQKISRRKVFIMSRAVRLFGPRFNAADAR